MPLHYSCGGYEVFDPFTACTFAFATSLNEVSITREKGSAIIQYKDPAYGTTHLQIGPEVVEMTDQEIVDLFNETLTAQAKLAAEYKHLVVEVP